MKGHTHTVECYSAIKKNILPLMLTTWMDFEGITLKEKYVRQRKTNTIQSHMLNQTNKKTPKLTDTENRILKNEMAI